MSVVESQIRKAEARAKGVDLAELSAKIRDKRPLDINNEQDILDRRDFLYSTLETPALADTTLERVLNGNELQPEIYLLRGHLAAKAVARLDIRSASNSHLGWGTGFLIAPGVLITNHHVFPDAASARTSLAHFD